MLKITIEGVPALNGSYPLDEERFTNRDFHTIKKISGLRPKEVSEGLEAGDTDIYVALAVCALYRAGHRDAGVVDALWDAEFGKILIEDETPEADAGPPGLTPPAERGSGNGKSNSSGQSSSGTGDLLASLPSPTGQDLSERSAT